MDDNRDYSRGSTMDDTSNTDKGIMRPAFPKRAVITAGMPYGNKELHFGHIGGVFVHADVFARFLRDRIGSENVIFVSGTDCYGSPIQESYQRSCKEGGFTGSIEEYVKENHEKQKKTLNDYEISLNLYAASAFGKAGETHKEVSDEIFMKLYEKGYLKKLSTPQFYDPEINILLNGRQVVGQCPIQGCNSEIGYADECSLGHQYMPDELISPKSTLSGKAPEVREVANWYFNLEDFRGLLKDWIEYRRKNTNSRKNLLNTMEEFLREPIIYVKKEQLDKLEQIREKLPEYKYTSEENKSSVVLLFKELKSREKATIILSEYGIYYRTGKTLVPFRLTGNVEWGVKAPVVEGMDNLTFWVWPESLWAPISFTRAYLDGLKASKLCDSGNADWRNWWCSKDTKVYQFIGEDNIYFYGIAEMALFMALQEHKPMILPEEGNLTQPHLIPNNHVLFMDKKASSSGRIKPPMAGELLEHYTPEQLRIHFLSLGLDTKSVSFKPGVYADSAEEGIDPVLKEGNLLTNVFNRLVRSCFYTAQKYYESVIPKGEVSSRILKEAEEAVLEYERHMYNHAFHRVTYVLDTYIRSMNKFWVNNIRKADMEDDDNLRRQVLIDTFHAVRVGMVLIHPIAPSGCDMIREYLGLNEEIWSWDRIFEPLNNFRICADNQKLRFLEPRVDFFKKHESQLQAD